MFIAVLKLSLMACAVLFLLLISGEALKWAQITPAQLNGMGILQLILTGCVGFSVAVWMIMNPRRVYKSITVILHPDCLHATRSAADVCCKCSRAYAANTFEALCMRHYLSCSSSTH